MCIRICFYFQKKKKHKKRQKAEKNKEEMRISVVNLTGYDDIVCNFLCVPLTYMIDASISPGFS